MSADLHAIPSSPVSPAEPPAPRRPRTPGGDGARLWRVIFSEPAFTGLTVLADVLAVGVAVVVALWWGGAADADMAGTWQLWLFPSLAATLLAARRSYRRRLRVAFLDEILGLEAALAFAALVLLAVMLGLGDNPRPGEHVVRAFIVAAALLPAGRLARAELQRHARRRGKVGIPTLVVGAGKVGHQIVRRLQQFPEYGLRPVGLLDREPPPTVASGHDSPVLGGPDRLTEVVRDSGAQQVILAFSHERDEHLLPVARTSQQLGLQVAVVPRLFDAVGRRVRVEHLGGLPVLNLDRVDPKGWHFAVKHAIDRTLALVGLLVLSPVLVTLAVLVRLGSPGPIFFYQRRIGRDAQAFELLKFRSMRPPREDATGFVLREGAAPGGVEGDDRRTRIGTFMRRTSLDELPQLINVVRGDMSLVGPRPERPEFVELFELQIRRYGERHRVKAGITGWAQVHGLRGQTSIADRAEWDNYYIENWSLWLDLKILALTVLTLFRRSED